MALIQEQPVFLPQSNWNSILSKMVDYYPNLPKFGKNQAGAKQILRLWQNWTSLLPSVSPQGCCQDTADSKLSMHNSFTERKKLLTNVL